MKVSFSTGFIIALLLLISCKKEMPCRDCGDPKIRSSFIRQYFKMGLNSKLELQLFALDTTTSQTSTGFGFCDFQGLSGDSTDVIKAAGNILWACNKVDSFIQVKSYKVVDSCPAFVLNINGLFELVDRNWYLDTLKFNGSIYLTPCGYEPGIQFGTNGKYYLGMVVNGTIAGYSIIGSDSVRLAQGPVTLLIAKTHYQRNFEDRLSEIIGHAFPFPDSTTVKYELKNNHLVITSKKGKLYFNCKN